MSLGRLLNGARQATHLTHTPRPGLPRLFNGIRGLRNNNRVATVKTNSVNDKRIISIVIVVINTNNDKDNVEYAFTSQNTLLLFFGGTLISRIN